MGTRKLLAISIPAIIVLLAVMVWFYPSSGDFRTDNYAWNGAREFSDSFGADMLSSLDDLPEVPENSVLVLIPYSGFSADDLTSLEGFVSNGGLLVLADDYGDGNTVLQYLGINASFSGEQLLDPLFNYRNSFFPRVTDFTGASFTEGVESILLNHATSLDTGAGVDVIARSSASSFLDLNDNRLPDEGEPAGALTVAAKCEYNRGLVFMLSDPSTIINCMNDTGDNYAFIGNIMRYNGPEPDIMLDQSHLPSDNLYQAKGGLIAVRDALATPAGIILIVTIVIILMLLPIWFRTKGGKHDGSDENKRRAGKNTR